MRRLLTTVAVALSLAVPQAYAGMIGVEDTERERVKSMLERPELAAELEKPVLLEGVSDVVQVAQLTGPGSDLNDTEAVADGGSVEHALTEDYFGHGEVHANHTSPWPFVISFALFTLFLGVSGLMSGGVQYLAITLIGLGLCAYSIVEFGKEDFFARRRVV
jgi:hypothetical protein